MRICYLTPLDRRGPWTSPEYGCGSWPLALGADLFPYAATDLAPLEAYDTLLLHTSMALYPRVLEVLERFRHKTCVLILTCDAMFIDPQGFFPGFQTPLKALLDRAALAISETEESAFFQAMSHTPVVHLPLPVPLAAMRLACSQSGGARNLQPVVLLGAGFRPRKNGLATALAFRRLRQRRSNHCRGIVFAEAPEAERAAYRAWAIAGVEVLPTCPQPEYWRVLAACDLALHLDYRRTIGRLAGEAAALGVPSISTAGATMQRACFPELIVEPWDPHGAADLAQRLLSDEPFRRRVLAHAGRAVEAFDLAPMAARFRKALALVATPADQYTRSTLAPPRRPSCP